MDILIGAIGRAIESYKTLGINVDDHFREAKKMIALAKGAQRSIQDFMLTRYACYLIAQNGDPGKEEIAFGKKWTLWNCRSNGSTFLWIIPSQSVFM